MAVKPSQLTSQRRGFAIDAQLRERVAGHDQTLLHLANALAIESATRYQSGLLLWNRAATSFINRLVAAHTWLPQQPPRGSLQLPVLQRIRDYVHEHMSGLIEVNDLASWPGVAVSFHARLCRSIGMTPYRYVVHLRLQAAIGRIRGGMSLAEVAADTGFSDQSHFLAGFVACRRRAIRARLKANSRNLSRTTPRGFG